MATIYNDRITAPLKWIEIDESDKLPLEDLQRECSEREYSDGTNKRRNKISPAEGCFITKQPGCLLENVYWVKPDARQRYRVASYLHDLSLVPLNFSLNDASNIAPLDHNLHFAFDKLGVFAVTCAKETLKGLRIN
ncbi:hypothetical protein D9613_012775 [Agrocybe pediades]|uniref:Uncharacterized protein n=1 Tax=Agrocybe pediades TaxID=84607 RepID=A0A8H4QLH5_9AGAR|nr:hypothetical protein D9613_012775 [Agrocybe pediades]